MNRFLRTWNPLVISMILVILLPGCSDDDPTTPPTQFDFTLEKLWPHEDGQSWTFDLSYVSCMKDAPRGYENEADVPGIPAANVLYRYLQEDGICEGAEIQVGEFDLRFDGDVVITPEISAHHLIAQQPPGERYLDRPIPLESGFWLMSEGMIVKYPRFKAEVDTVWVYLTSDLDPGDRFIIPAPFNNDDGLTIESTIRRHLEYTLPDGSMANALEVFFLFDMGIQQYTNEEGEPNGYVGGYLYGNIFYAEGVGPVYCRQQFAMILPGIPAGKMSVTSDNVAVLKDW